MGPNKHERMEAWLAEKFAGGQDSAAACIRGYRECFQRGDYYEAHDALEHLWLQLPRTAPEYRFYKGLIQLAGGFVHLRLHYLEPGHRVHGRRLAPAGKLFALAVVNMREALEHGLPTEFDVPALLALAEEYSPVRLAEREGSGELRNPWSPDQLPRIS